MAENERHTAATDLNAHTQSMNVDTPTPEAEAGPSRTRRSSADPISNSGPDINASTVPPPRPSSPSTTLPKSTPRSNGDEATAQSSGQSEQDPAPPRSTLPHLDLANYPTQQLLRLLASLLQQIASANDQLRPESNEDGDEDGGMGDDGQSTSSGTRSRADSRASNTPQASSTPTPTPNASSSQAQIQAQSLVNPNLNPAHPSPTTALFKDGEAPPPSSSLKPADSTRRQSTSPTTGRAETLFSASKTSLNHRSSLLSFHARHIPSISIEAYLLRILKYCPTTNEVFLGLLVYFDRMSRLGTPGGLGGMMKGGKGFAIDSYNVHRLVIAGVTVASKFFSDVFYTNSRYAKVGGLPPHELNQLELQFLLLNDFRLVIPFDEMQRYGNRLLGYWENKEAEERNTPSTDGVGLPTEDQVKQAQALQKTAPPPAPAPATTTPVLTNEERRSTTKTENEVSRSSSSSSSAQPSERGDRPVGPEVAHGTPYDNGPANEQAPTSAITTA